MYDRDMSAPSGKDSCNLYGCDNSDTPGESIDVVVTDYGVAVNPARQDLLEALKNADCVPLRTIEELRDIAYDIVGTPQPVKFGERIVGIIEGRDGTIMDVVREVK